MVQGRVHFAQVWSKRPSNIAAMANANASSTGFKAAPSGAAGIRRRKGLEVHNVNNMNPPLTSPMTPRTRLEKLKGSWRLKAATATLQIDRINIHRSSEPSCAPHKAATL